ncbi:hypothetical protein M431DRAFT_512840 [Trichoderma harzianum CBS 226.95]|uniref:Secreted protein n=1 Tax=Trichoderma harzianum CBS 226.95 TaxID=983964 RepID=A0A2T3ZX45_TRIHA|nr:hypothetical protein M431DRAFT_512840 [Trichoderma harzianum CBS 226.95]PTB49380.1 hypothetical protein M431DRAFT_512840 [Trichoderma harzianum CBS 226.95]
MSSDAQSHLHAFLLIQLLYYLVSGLSFNSTPARLHPSQLLCSALLLTFSRQTIPIRHHATDQGNNQHMA